jgi:hypothetical protein
MFLQRFYFPLMGNGALITLMGLVFMYDENL